VIDDADKLASHLVSLHRLDDLLQEKVGGGGLSVGFERAVERDGLECHAPITLHKAEAFKS
jgi:hypothetical protein